MSDDPTEALPPRGKSLRILVVEGHANTLRVLARLLDHFGMNIRSLFVCSALLLFANVAYGAGSYQPTRDGKALVWNDSPKRGEEATWSGRRDKNGFAAGSGTLTWYQVEPTIVTGSNIPDARRYAVVISRCSGKMVEGKFEGAVTYVDANGKRLQATFVNGDKPPAKRNLSPAAQEPPTAVQQTASVAKMVEGKFEGAVTHVDANGKRLQATFVNGGKRPAKRNLSPAAQEPPTAVQQAASVAPEQTATRTSEQQARQPDAQSTIAPIPTPLALPTPPLTVDAQMVGALDTVYRAALKANDIAIMDQILTDDFVLVNDRGASLTKADLINEAREKRTIYEDEEVEQGTQKVRIWRDTAVVTELLRIKGTRDQPPFKVWFSETYVRTPTGWRCVFGQASIPKPDAK
jgi:ketosteroid isomerase-like protein